MVSPSTGLAHEEEDDRCDHEDHHHGRSAGGVKDLVHAGDVAPARARGQYTRPHKVLGLATPRQFEALALVVLTGSYQEAADAMGIRRGTVKNHLMELHRVTDETTFQLAHRFRGEIALWAATHPGRSWGRSS